LVNGQVRNKSGLPLAGATIAVKGRPSSTITDERGAYAIATFLDEQLVFSYVDYIPQVIKVKGENFLEIVLEQKDKSMETVTISTGYQRIEQKYLTGSVTSLKMDSLMQPGLSTIDKMLEGRVPGMIYMQNSGQPGAAPKLRIRGNSTYLGSQEPLWVVDGIVQTDPVSIPASRINDLDFVNLIGNAISGINPNDVEQIDVLKDAAATALYGVRAANGVIVVTTKRGKAGPPTVNYFGSLTYTRRPRYTDNGMNMMNSKERVEVSKEMIDKQLPFINSPEGYEKAYLDYNNGLIDYDTYSRKIKQAETINTDWLDLVMQDVFSSNHNISLSGGNQQTSYYASLGYINETGAIRSEYNKLYTGRVRLNVNYKNFKGAFNLEARKNDRNYVPTSIKALDYAYGTSRSISAYNDDGSPYFYSTKLNDNISTNAFTKPSFNILNEIDHSGQSVGGTSYAASTNLNYQLLRGLQLESTLSYESAETEEKTWFDEKTNFVDKIRGEFPGNKQYDALPIGGELSRATTRKFSWTARIQAIFSQYLDKRNKHQLNMLLGTEAQSTKYSKQEQVHRAYFPERGYSFGIIDLREYAAYASWLQSAGMPKITDELNNIAAAYLNTSYIFNDKYVIGASTRSDFSNAFGSRSNEKFLPTWSFSGRWNLDRDLLAHVKWVTMAALRLSYGTRGNMLTNQSPYTVLSKDQYSTVYQGFSSVIQAYPNPNLQWEKVKNYEVNIDFSLFKNKFNGTIGYYYTRTINAFLNKRVSMVNGTSAYTVNGGEIENRGIELQLNFTPINNIGSDGKRKGFVWRIDPNLGQAFNKLFDNTINAKKNVLVDDRSVTFQQFLNGEAPVNGKAINTFYAYRFKELDNKGQPVFYGLEGDNGAALLAKFQKMSKSEVYQTVFVEAGKRQPVMQGSVANFFGYRNWTLNFVITYSIGNKIRLMRLMSGSHGTYKPTSQSNLRKEFVNRWRYPGDELFTNIPGLSDINIIPWWSTGGYFGPPFANNYYQMYDDADIRIVKGDYAKLQSCELAYNFNPQTCAQLHVKYLRMSLAGSNLHTFASKELNGQDPTQSGSAPGITLSLRPVYTFNINVSF
ncbi:MAG: SusC/RagA family TonB-linked outer membrane protein, partial [Chitinophagaceae bacterium]|nr:SusC/RagA family TonB-linked outer membrane protein [Chitinophagaceae bacterium]